jgi:hypothetical protein
MMSMEVPLLMVIVEEVTGLPQYSVLVDPRQSCLSTAAAVRGDSSPFVVYRRRESSPIFAADRLRRLRVVVVRHSGRHRLIVTVRRRRLRVVVVVRHSGRHRLIVAVVQGSSSPFVTAVTIA